MSLFSNYLPWAGMIEDGIIITKDLMLLRAFSFCPKDFSYLNESEIITSLNCLNNSFRFLDDGWTIYIDAFRRKGENARGFFPQDAPETAIIFDNYRRDSLGDFYYTKYYISFLYSPANKKTHRSYLFQTDSDCSISEDLVSFKAVTEDIYQILKSVFSDVKILDSSGLLTYLHSFYSNLHPVIMPECPFYLDVYLSDATFTPDTVCRLNDEYILTASIHDFPSHTHAGMVTKLLDSNIEFHLSTRFIFLSKENAKKKDKRAQETSFSEAKGYWKNICRSCFKRRDSFGRYRIFKSYIRFF